MPNSKRQIISDHGEFFFGFGRFGLFRVSLAFGVLEFGVF
jgi:hypothetical protein